MKSFISILSIIDLLVIMMIGPSVLASDTASVSATVTVQNISVSVSDGSINYGTLAVGASKSTCDLNDTQTVTNTGNVAETFNVMGSTSTDWSLGSSPASETYVHKFSSSTCPVTWGGTALTLAYQTLVTNVATSATSTLNLQVTTPSATVHFTPETFTVTVQAVASS
jgi:hypothetical protein